MKSVGRPASIAAAVASFLFSLPAFGQEAAEPSIAPDAQKDDVVVLSPFVVTTEQDQGYYAPNTLAGSRMKTNLADIGASISIVNKAQMEDFASTDVNDVFRYEVNTEGSTTYTPATQAFRNDGILDVNAGGTQGNLVSAYTNASANRVRGIGIPDSAINYYPSIRAIPPDVYNLQTVEISRGPNSMLFGMGSPAGIVNTSTAQALIGRDSNRVQVRVDENWSNRISFSFNRTLLKDKLAVFGAVLYDDKEFLRKPSYDRTRRQYAAITYKPFKKTTVRFNFEHYDNWNRRPNTISPTDFITQWDLAGRPAYDALNKTVTLLNTGETFGPYISSNSSPNAQQVRDYVMSLPNYDPALRGTSATALGGTDTTFTYYNGFPIFGTQALNPIINAAHPDPSGSVLYVPGMSQINGRAAMQIGDGQLQNWFQPLYNASYRTTYNSPGEPTPPAVNNPISNIWGNPASADVYDRNYYVSTGWTNNSFLTNLGNYRYPGVTDRSIYDWKNVNILQADFGTQSNKNYELDLEQQILDNLFLNAGWLRQDFKQSSNYTIGQLNATAVAIDESKYLPNGSPNPYFGLPFVYDRDPDRYVIKQLDDHYRAMLAWTPDFTRNTGWTRWLGHHQVLGLWSRDESLNSSDRQRLSYVSADDLDGAVRYVNNPNFPGFSLGRGSTQRLFYLANPGDPMGTITRGSGTWDESPVHGDIQVYDYQNNQFKTVGVTEDFITGITDPVRTEVIVQSLSGGMTNYFWKDRLITTFGARVDKYRARSTTAGVVSDEDGNVILPALASTDRFLPDGYYNYDSIWNHWNNYNRTTGRTKTGGFVLSPFRNWSSIDRRANEGSFFWQVVQNFGLVYNWSDNFDAPSGPQNDAFGNQLPNPQGVGRDMGFQFSALDNKLFVRMSWFRSTNENQRLSAGTAIGRLTSVPVDPAAAPASVDGLFRSWARTIAEINMGIDVTDPDLPALTADQEAAVDAAAADIWQLPFDYYQNLPGAITATGNAVATGFEVQVNYNTHHWRNRLTFSKAVTTNSDYLKEYQSWYDERAPIWSSAKASDFLLPQYQSMATYVVGDPETGRQVDLTNFLSSYGYTSTVRNTNGNGGLSPQNWIDVNLTPQVQIAKDLDGQEAPGQRKYRWAYNTGYDFTEGRLRGWGIGGAERWESKSVIGYYGKSSGGNSANPSLIDISDVTRPIYDSANYYTDLFINYKTKISNDRIGLTIQANVEDVFHDAHLQVVAVNYDGSPYGYRILDGRKFSLTATFDF